jgi:hypothetical protein
MSRSTRQRAVPSLKGLPRSVPPLDRGLTRRVATSAVPTGLCLISHSTQHSAYGSVLG